MPNKLPDINLLPKYERRSSSHYPIFIGLIVALILAYGWIGFYYFTTKSKLNDQEVIYTEIVLDNEILQAQIDKSASNGEADVKDILSFIEGHDMQTSYFLEEVDDLLPKNSYLSEYVYDNYDGQLIAHFETLDDIAAYTTNLIDSPFSNDVLVNGIGTFKPRDNEETNAEQLLHIPRYETTFTIDIHKDTLRGVHDRDE